MATEYFVNKCSIYFSEANVKPCGPSTYGNGSGSFICYNLSCPEVVDICKTQTDFSKLSSVITYIYRHQNIFFSPIALLSNILLLCTLFSSEFSHTTFIYLRIAGIFQLFQMTSSVMNKDASHNHQYTTNFYGVVFYPAHLTPFFKFSNFMITVFLSFEQFLAVCCTVKYSGLDRKKLFLSVFAAMVVGSLELFPLAQYRITEKNNNGTSYIYFTIPQYMTQYHLVEYMEYAVTTIRLIGLITLVYFSAAIIKKIYSRKEIINSTMGQQSALREHKEMVKLCWFQVIDTFVIIIDTMMGLGRTAATVSNNSDTGGSMEACRYGDQVHNLKVLMARNVFNMLVSVNDV